VGELHDSTEIDEILTLRTLTLTDEEKREARATDDRAGAIVDRVEALRPDELARLHGTFRAPDLAKGAKVRLHPKRRADAQDIFLVGKLATIRDTLVDVDGRGYVAVTLDDDPGADLHLWYGRFLYFSPDEIELVASPGAETSAPSIETEERP
jgi:hypothetical protein